MNENRECCGECQKVSKAAAPSASCGGGSTDYKRKQGQIYGKKHLNYINQDTTSDLIVITNSLGGFKGKLRVTQEIHDWVFTKQSYGMLLI